MNMKKSTVRMAIMTAFIGLFLSAGAANAQTGCSKTTKAQLVQAIKQQFEADAEIKEQMRHLNISIKKRRVTLEGWLNDEMLIKRAVAVARKTKCARSVVSRLKTTGSGSCGAGLKPCGDTCINERSECTIDIAN